MSQEYIRVQRPGVGGVHQGCPQGSFHVWRSPETFLKNRLLSFKIRSGPAILLLVASEVVLASKLWLCYKAKVTTVHSTGQSGVTRSPLSHGETAARRGKDVSALLGLPTPFPSRTKRYLSCLHLCGHLRKLLKASSLQKNL